MASRRMAISLAHLAIGPMVSKSSDIGHTPSCDMRRRVGFREYTSFLVAGIMIEALVSVPRATGAKPAATATQDPEDEPPALCSQSANVI